MISREIEHNIKGSSGFANSMMRSASSGIGSIVVAIIILTWLHWQGLKVVVRQLRAHPENKPLWVAVWLTLASAIAFVLLLRLGGNVTLISAAVFEVSFWLMVAVAKIVEIVYDWRLQREWNREVLVHEVLHEPW